ncbi:hypothetical protein [Gluconacetobacter diazotrophicus]|uniref:hypothetical protein n=1 Tax=Gluconacetobacter diazotrophicus TaxID=33996 RepID=UPI0011A9889F|nr:hypothetical protein [Gluconacetobacter diazotrophicus]
MTKKQTFKTINFDEVDVSGVKYKSITVKAPTFKQVRTATSHIKNPTLITMEETSVMMMKFVISCGTSDDGPIIEQVVDELPYNVVSDAGTFCMSFM